MEQGIEFFDSNVFIAGSISTHAHHAASAARLASLQAGGGACAAHSLAEAYNNFTNSPRGFGLPPTDAMAILNHAVQTYTIITLDAGETLTVMDDAAKQGLTGAIIYDALIVACARKIDARVIYTWNVKHFRRVAPDLADRIMEP